MKLALAVIALAMAGAAEAGESSSVGKVEQVAAPSGCWNEMPSASKVEFEAKLAEVDPGRIPYQATICFEDNGVLTSFWVGGHEAMEGGGSYEMEDRKLYLTETADHMDGWVLGAEAMACDLVFISPMALRLVNCIGLEADAGKLIPDRRYEFADD